jgi:hypothetical protein
VVTDHSLVHGDDGVQHGKRTAVDRGDELGADLHTLLLPVVRQKFGDPSCGLLFKAQVAMENGVNGQNGCPMGSSQSLNAQPAVFLNGSGNRGDESRGLDSFFAVEMALVIGGFSVFHLLDDGVNCRFLERLFTVDVLNHLFYFQIAFAGSGEIGDEVADARHSTGW